MISRPAVLPGLLALVVLLPACGPFPSRIDRMGGGDQAALAGQAVDLPYVFQVFRQSSDIDAPEIPFEGAEVHFIVEGGGSVPEEVVLTDRDGFARSTWTLGTEGPQTLRVAMYRDNGEFSLDTPFDYTGTVITRGEALIDARDDQSYETLIMGTQRWMSQNLRFESIASVQNPGAPDPWGRLYTWDDALTACPAGWHLPTDDEWVTLEMLLGRQSVTSNPNNAYGRGMKATVEWSAGGEGTNTTGFEAYPAGRTQGLPDSFIDFGIAAEFWTATEHGNDPKAALSRALVAESNALLDSEQFRTSQLSVRCVED